MRPIMVGGAVAHPAATTELDMKVSLHGQRSSSVKQALVFFASENETTVSRCAAPTASIFSWPVGRVGWLRVFSAPEQSLRPPPTLTLRLVEFIETCPESVPAMVSLLGYAFAAPQASTF